MGTVETINYEVYCDTLRKLIRAIQNKWHGMLNSGIVFLHNKIHLNTVASSQGLLNSFE